MVEDVHSAQTGAKIANLTPEHLSRLLELMVEQSCDCVSFRTMTRNVHFVLKHITQFQTGKIYIS